MTETSAGNSSVRDGGPPTVLYCHSPGGAPFEIKIVVEGEGHRLVFSRWADLLHSAVE